MEMKGLAVIIRRLMPMVTAIGVVLIGGWCMLATAPGHIPDIWSHIYRIAGIVNGDVMVRPVDSVSYLHGGTGNVGGHVDWEWIEYSQQHYDGYDPTVVRSDSIKVFDESGADVPYNNTATNSPVAYLPQLVVFGVGKMQGFPADVTYHLAELLMLLIYAGCAAASVALLPRWRIIVGLAMLCPLLIRRYAFAISADSLTQALAFLFSCMVFRTLYCKVSNRYCIVVACVSVLLAMCKFIYAPMVALALLIPYMQRGLSGDDAGTASEAETARRLAVWRDPRLWICAAGDALAFLWLAVWMRTTNWFVTTPMIVSYDQMSEKKAELFSGPAGILDMLHAVWIAIVHGKANLDSRADSLVITMFWALWGLVAIVLLAASVARTMSKRRLVFWWCAVVVSTGIMLLTYVALWLQYTPVGAAVVEGMQHRYFFPLVILMLLCGLECLHGLWYRRRVCESGLARTNGSGSVDSRQAETLLVPR